MLKEIRATLLLADHAQVAEGKLNTIGAGWSITGPQPAPFALAALVEFPWTAAGTDHTARFELIDSEGVSVEVPTPDGDKPLAVEILFPVAAGFGVSKGTPLVQALAVNSGPVPIPPGGRYEWRLLIDGETDDTWRVGFSTRPMQKAA